MPKQAKSSTAKVREICHQYPNEFGAIPSGDLQAKLVMTSSFLRKHWQLYCVIFIKKSLRQ